MAARLSPAARAIWNAKHPDYRCVRAEDGVRCVLYLNPATGATELWPVEAVAAALATLPKAVQS